MGDENRGGGGAKALSGSEFAGLGLQFAVAILVFLYVGKRVDGWLGTSPIFLIVGVFVGAGAAFYSIYRKVTTALPPKPADRGGSGSGAGR